MNSWRLFPSATALRNDIALLGHIDRNCDCLLSILLNGSETGLCPRRQIMVLDRERNDETGLPVGVFRSQAEFDERVVGACRALGSSPSEHRILDDLRSLGVCVENRGKSAVIASVSFLRLRDYIRQVLSTNQPSGVVVSGGVLLLKLIGIFPSAYEELSLSLCFHHITRVLRDAGGFKCGGKCNSERCCSAPGRISLRDYRAFWAELLALIRLQSNQVSSSGFLSLCVGALVDLIRYGRGSWFQALSVAGIEAVLVRSQPEITTALYKALFPLIRMTLPSNNRTAIVQALKLVSAREQNLISSSPQLSTPPGLHNVRSPLTLCINSKQNFATSGSDGIQSCAQRVSGIMRFLELCVIHVVDRAEQRSSLCALVLQVLQGLGHSSLRSFMGFISKALSHPQGRVRLFAVEFTALTIDLERGLPDSRLVGPELSKLLLDRVNDRIPMVRTKAVVALGESLKVECNPRLTSVVENLVDMARRLAERVRDPKSRVRKAAVDYVGLTCQRLFSCLEKNLFVESSNACEESPAGDKGLVGLLERRVVEVLQLLKCRTSDSVSNVRLATISQVTEVIAKLPAVTSGSFKATLMSFWCEAVLPHVDDADPKCRESCLAAVESVFLARDTTIVPSGEKNADLLTSLFLSEIGGENQSTVDLGRRAITTLCGSRGLSFAEVSHLAEKVRGGPVTNVDEQHGAWVAIAEISGSGAAPLVHRALGHERLWQEVVRRLNAHACVVASNLLRFMSRENRESLADSLRDLLFSENHLAKGSSSHDFFFAAVDLLASLSPEDGSSLLECCEQGLFDSSDHLSNDKKEVFLLLIGAICGSFALTSEPRSRLVVYVVALASDSTSDSKLRALALSTLGKLCLFEKRSGKASVKTRETGTEHKSTYTCVNKHGESLTRRHVSIFVREMENAKSSAIRNNALIVLCDLCRQFTAIVEPYIPRLARLLSDPSVFIRIQALSSLVGLLQEDYIKVRKGGTLFPIAMCLVDADATVRATAEYALLRVISPKSPSILATSLIELVLALNRCTDGNLRDQLAFSGEGTRSHEMTCDDCSQRQSMYAVFLEGMTFEQRLHLPARFRTEILSPLCDGKLPISSPSVQAVLQDTLYLLTCDEVLLAVPGNGFEERTGVDSTSQTEAAIEQKTSGGEKAATSKKFGLLRRVQMVELKDSTIPVMLELRHRLENLRSPLLEELMSALCALMRPCLDEIDLVIADPVVRSEIQHEMSRMSKEKRAAKRPGKLIKPEQSKTCKRNTEGNRPTEEQVMTLGTKNLKTLPMPLAVPRTRPSTKRRNRSMPSEEEDPEIEKGIRDAEKFGQLSMRIEASPKLAAIAGKVKPKALRKAESGNAREQPSAFAMAQARIEEAAEN